MDLHVHVTILCFSGLSLFVVLGGGGGGNPYMPENCNLNTHHRETSNLTQIEGV
jgi:hypothetical protein